MKGILVAVNFLTIVPLSSGMEVKEEDYGRSMLYFPVVGAAMGFAIWMVNIFFHAIMSSAVAAALTLVFWVGISGALHLDGLADTCDGFYGGKDRDGILSIMRDSRTGPMGAAAVAMALFVKYSALISVGGLESGAWIIEACALSRWAMALSAASALYARELGTGKFFVENVGKKEVLIATGIALFLALIIFGAGGLVIVALVAALTMALTHYFKKRIGGVTGDTLGAVNETCELAVLIFMALVLKLSEL